MSSSIHIRGDFQGYDCLLNGGVLNFLKDLQLNFNRGRLDLLRKRHLNELKIQSGDLPTFLKETEQLRHDNTWQVSPVLNKDSPIHSRLVDIVVWKQTDKAFFEKCLKSGANGLQFDFDDSYSPTWENNLKSQQMLYDFLLTLNQKNYKSNATVLIRPRSLNLNESHILVQGDPLCGAFYDFGVWTYHYIQTQYLKENGVKDGPYFYLPKIESYMEARWWDEVLAFTEYYFNIPYGSIKVFVHIENVLASFQMEEILYELKDHCLGLNTGRWDYIFSYIKKFRDFPQFLVPERSQLGMDKTFLRTWEALIVDTCLKRGGFATGGMAPQIPQGKVSESLFKTVFESKVREKNAGLQGALVAHPELVESCRKAFLNNVTSNRPSLRKLSEEDIAELLIAPPKGTVSVEGINMNLKVVVTYIKSWLNGKGGCPLDGGIEDIATCEISRSQLWQWIRHKQKTIDGVLITADLIHQELEKHLDKANDKRIREIMASLLDSNNYVSFLSNFLYDYIVHYQNMSKL